jgi:hypothetical protein
VDVLGLLRPAAAPLRPKRADSRKRCTATAYAGFPGAQAQRSYVFAPGNPDLGYLVFEKALQEAVSEVVECLDLLEKVCQFGGKTIVEQV